MKSKLILPSIRAVIGDWVYYSSVMSANQISEWIQTAKEIREAKELDEILQRDLKDRKVAISKYLMTNESRFFNSIIVGVFEGIPDWVSFDMNALSDFFNNEEEMENIEESIGMLSFKGDEKMFAIDGQHRVAGIKISSEQDKKGILKDDQFSVIFIAHIDDELGRKRTRKLFSDINKNAKPVAEGDKLKIDEENLNAIVARKLYAEYSYFDNGKIISLTEGAKLDNKDDAHFTNLLGLNNSNKVLKKLFKKVPKTHEWEEINTNEFYQIVTNFYDFIIENVAEYKEFFIDKKTILKDLRSNNSHLLFRPVGLKLLANLYVHFSKKENGLDQFKNNINKISFVFPESPFNNILWNNGKMEAKELNQKLAFDVALYILGEIKSADQEKRLIERYRDLLKNPDAKLPDKLN